jgi:hypothetical protein
MTDQQLNVRLDRSKPHGTVHGVIEDGVHFHQGGLPFDAKGHLVTHGLTEAQVAIAERRARRGRKAAPGDDAGDPVRVASRGAPDDDGNDAPGAEADEVNLESWLRGDAKYLFDTVRAAIRNRYSKDVKSIGDAVEFLVADEKLMATTDVTRRLAK